MFILFWRNWLQRTFPSSRQPRRLPRPRRGSYRPPRLRLEALEDRTLLSATLPSVDPSVATPDYVVYHPSGNQPFQFPTPTGPVGFSPQQVQTAYGIDQLFGIIGDGAGQTIALVDAYDDPNLLDSTNPAFNTSDLHQFDVQYGLPDPPSFLKLGQTGTGALPGPDPAKGWEGEEALDVEWAHSLAPGANIILFEANDASNANLYAAVATAAGTPGVSVVSMSFGGNEFAGEQGSDTTFQTPPGHNPVTFLASTGDNGSPGGYPAYSPNVIAVGGTALTLNPNNTYKSETGWGNGAQSSTLGGSGGGISQFENEPAYQESVQKTGKRTIPDVAFLADPNTGVWVYDSFTNGAATPWNIIGGTSLASPSWAALISIADEGLVQNGGTTLDGATQTLPDLYELYQSNPGDFHDITTGNNGAFSAGPGYDEVTGLGSPAANLLIPDLIGLNVSITLHNATEGQPLTNVPVAVFHGQSNATGTYAATIYWGDGSSSAGTVVNSGGENYTVLGSHTYSEEGNYTLTVNVSQPGQGKSRTVSGPINVADAPLVASPQPPLTSATGSFLANALVATFQDTDTTPESPSNYTATVFFEQAGGAFGSSTGTIVALGNNTFGVYGSNPFSYATSGSFVVRVVITDVGGASVTVQTGVNVAGKPAIPPLIPMYQADTSTVNVQFNTMENALTNLLTSQYVFALSAFASPTGRLNAFANLMFAEFEYEMAVFQFDMTLPF